MNTEKAYRDLGEAIIKAYDSLKEVDGPTRIIVHAERIHGASQKVAFYVHFQSPIVVWTATELQKVAIAEECKRKREEEKGNDRY